MAPTMTTSTTTASSRSLFRHALILLSLTVIVLTAIINNVSAWESDFWKQKGGLVYPHQGDDPHHHHRPDDSTTTPKSLNNTTTAPKEVCDAWQQHDAQLIQFIERAVPEALVHNGASPFDLHLRGVQAVLRSWDAPEYLTDAGLFHSIYGTQGFQGFKISMLRRPDIRELIGEKAERLAWIFCTVDRTTLDATLDMEDDSNDRFLFQSRIELGRFDIVLTGEEEWLDFLELTLADWLEQVEGGASKQNLAHGWELGQAWMYRRRAYRRIMEILSAKRAPRLLEAKRMYEAVYAKESEETRHLHQPETPPMSDAAKEAQEALTSVYL